MPFEPPKPVSLLPKQEREELLREYLAHYCQAWKSDPSSLNRKLPRKAFVELLNDIGAVLLSKSQEMAEKPGEVREFLDENHLPVELDKHLPDDFRVYCLALNALKVWVSAEQLRTDRYLLGGNARKECRAAATTCIVTDEPLSGKDINLHHPVRDGRPPIPLSKKGHDRIEKQVRAVSDDSVDSKLLALRGRNRSWVQLRRGCLDLSGKNPAHSTPNVGASSRTFARQASEITGLSYDELLEWLDRKNRGLAEK